MRSRAARLTLLMLFIVSLSATAYLFWRGEAQEAESSASLHSFTETAHATIRAVLEFRAAQQAYVAAGQSGELWPGRAADALDVIGRNLDALRKTASSQEAASELGAALTALNGLRQLDRRARDHARAGQNLLASDLIFGDAAQAAARIDGRIEKARALETAHARGVVDTYENRQAFALAAGAAAASLVLFLLLPLPEAEPVRSVPAPLPLPRAAPPERPAPASDLELEHEGWRPARATAPDDAPIAASVSEPAATPSAPPVEVSPAPLALSAPAPEGPRTDFLGVARLCTDLARIDDTHQLPTLLDRASSLLDARGIILWIADPDGRELNAIVAHGYAPQLLNRLGTIGRDADNATAAAFRTSLVQTVPGAADENGAIAAPLVTAHGCVGVMAAEVRGESERDDSRLAAASIVAAQLATLVGPPVRGQGRVEEAAGA